MYSARVKEAVDYFNEIYSLAEFAYKRLQQFLLKIDDEVHHEFRYCSRAMRDFVVCCDHSTEEQQLAAIERATHAVKIAFNDSIDLVLMNAAMAIEEFSNIDSGRELVFFIHDLHDVVASIQKINEMISESRADNGKRIEFYAKILHSNEFKSVVKFSEKIDVFRNVILTERGRVVRDGRKFVVTVSISVVAALFSLVQILQKMPDFIKYLSHFFPSLEKFVF